MEENFTADTLQEFIQIIVIIYKGNYITLKKINKKIDSKCNIITINQFIKLMYTVI